LLSVATAAVVVAVINPSSGLGLVLGCRPLRWIGVRSYGIYLWHWPLIVLWGPQHTSVDWPRAALQVAATFVLAGVSWRYVEDPIRRGALGRILRSPRSPVAAVRARGRALALSTAAVALVSLVVAALNGALPVASSGHTAPQEIAKLPPQLPSATVALAPASNRRPNPALPPPTHTSCRSVVYIGDSTSEGEISTDYIPNPRQRLPAQLAKVGVTKTYPEISGARSIIETFEGKPNAATVARAHIIEGFHGCWILALGTNDVDNATTSPVGLTTRINHMMKVIGHQPVLWIDVITLLSSGPYGESGMQRWNEHLLAACRRYPTMRIYDWAAHAKRRWFIPDGIHYYSPGYVARNHDIAKGLVHAFPQTRPRSASCLVR
jgi:hypothetical protein